MNDTILNKIQNYREILEVIDIEKNTFFFVQVSHQVKSFTKKIVPDKIK